MLWAPHGLQGCLFFPTGLPCFLWLLGSMVSILVPKSGLPTRGSWPLGECFPLTHLKSGWAGVGQARQSCICRSPGRAEFRGTETRSVGIPAFPRLQKEVSTGRLRGLPLAIVFVFPSRHHHSRQSSHPHGPALWNWPTTCLASLFRRTGVWNLGALRTYLVYQRSPKPCLSPRWPTCSVTSKCPPLPLVLLATLPPVLAVPSECSLLCWLPSGLCTLYISPSGFSL